MRARELARSGMPSASLSYTVTIVQILPARHAEGCASAHVSGKEAGGRQAAMDMIDGFARFRLVIGLPALTRRPFGTAATPRTRGRNGVLAAPSKSRIQRQADARFASLLFFCVAPRHYPVVLLRLLRDLEREFHDDSMPKQRIG